jgi:serine/threonine protein kinase
MENAELDVNTEPMNKSKGTAPLVPVNASENCLPVGTRLSEFELTGIIGEGGFGSVYLAFDHSLQRTVAIKEYMPGALAGRNDDRSVMVRSERHKETFLTGLRSFINEARLLAQFDHPALIKVHRFWEENNTAYMAMRYYEGQTLKNVVKTTPEIVTEEWLRTMLKPILEALEALYKVNILHRDISPDNIMIQKTGGAVLLDFGAARQIIGDMTQALTVILKPGYAPVEQYAEDASMKQGPWTDIYALCAVLFVAITKKPPPTSVARMIKDPIDWLSTTKYPNFSENFLAAVNKGLAVNPDNRPQTIDEFRNLIGIDDGPTTIAPQTVAPVVKPNPPIAKVEVTPPAAQPAAQVVPPVAKETPQPPVAKPAEVLKPADEQVGATVLIMPKGKTESKAEDKKPPQKKDPEVKPKAEKKDPVAKAPRKKGSGKGIALVVGLLVIAGIGGYGAYMYNNPDQAPQFIADMMAPPKVAVQPIVPPPPPPVQPTVDESIAAWDDVKDETRPTADSIGDIANFINTYPNSKFIADANAKLQAQTREATKSREDSLAFTASADGSATDATAQEEVKGNGTMMLDVKPWGNILVDDAPKGVSPPIKKVKIPEGKHHIKISNPGFPDYVVDIDVLKNKTVNIEHDFTAR